MQIKMARSMGHPLMGIRGIDHAYIRTIERQTSAVPGAELVGPKDSSVDIELCRKHAEAVLVPVAVVVVHLCDTFKKGRLISP